MKSIAQRFHWREFAWQFAGDLNGEFRSILVDSSQYPRLTSIGKVPSLDAKWPQCNLSTRSFNCPAFSAQLNFDFIDSRVVVVANVGAIEIRAPVTRVGDDCLREKTRLRT